MGFEKIIAVDFDGCLCENSWPEIGDDNPEVVRALLEEQKNGAKIILWTCREGELLQAALDWCEKRDIRFDCVNEPWPELKKRFGNDTRKIFATEYWDDRAVETPAPRYLNRLARDIHENAVSHGWWESERSFGEIVALCHSELSEALEEFRNDKPALYFKCKLDGVADDDECADTQMDCHFRAGNGIVCEKAKPEGTAVEMIDCIIRILDWCGKEKIDVDYLLRLKHEYNKTRPYRHGGKAL